MDDKMIAREYVRSYQRDSQAWVTGPACVGNWRTGHGRDEHPEIMGKSQCIQKVALVVNR